MKRFLAAFSLFAAVAVAQTPGPGETIDQQIAALQAQIAALEAQAHELPQMDLDALQAQIDTLSANIAALQAQLDGLLTQTDLDAMQNQLDALDARITALETEQTQQRIEIDDHEARITALEDSPPPSSECGNGILETGEECDDGNTVDGDGCSSTCTVETPPPPPGDLFEDYQVATLVCPDGSGGFVDVVGDAMSNDPYGDGCWAKPMDVDVFFDGAPFDCSSLKDQFFYLGAYPFSDGLTIDTKSCSDVTTNVEWDAATQFGKHEQKVVILHNDVTLENSDVGFYTNRGELLVIGVPDADNRPPTVTSNVAPFAWRPVSNGNLAIVNIWFNTLNNNMPFWGSADDTKQTVTLVGVTHGTGGRLGLFGYEGGTDPETLNPDDEIYIRNVLKYRATTSHNFYLDRVYIDYAEGLVSYSVASLHPLKMDAQYIYLYGSYLANAGIHGRMATDTGGLAPLSAVACQEGVVRDNQLTNTFTNGASNANNAQHQHRRALGAACDQPVGYTPNTYPAPKYTGGDTYRGVFYAATPFWDPTWWQQIDESDYSDPDMLHTYYLDNQMKLDPVDSNPNLFAFMSQGTFPGTTTSQGSSNFRPVDDEPPQEWFDRSQVVLANNCLDPGLQLYQNHQNENMKCSGNTVDPPWLATWPECVAGATYLNEENHFKIEGNNDCGTDTLSPELINAIQSLEAIPNPPWRSWQ